MSSVGYEMDWGLRTYLREIAKTDLLTPQQEVDLAERIKKWDPEARSHMIKANLRLVVKIAQDYSWYGLPLLDLISEGNIWLMKAVERFDPNKGGKLSTYAAWWIKQSIKRALANQSKTIRLPVHMVDKISKMRRIAMSMSEELGREPTDDELSEEIGIDRAKLAQMKVAAMRPASLDAPVSAEDDTEFWELVGDDNAIDPATQAAMSNALEQVPWLLTVLDERELKILNARFWLDDKKPRTLEEVGQDFGVTRERIRQVQNIALRKLRRALQKKEDLLPKTLRRSADKWWRMKTSALTRDTHSLGIHQKTRTKKRSSSLPQRKKRSHVFKQQAEEKPTFDQSQTISVPEKPRVEFWFPTIAEEPIADISVLSQATHWCFVYAHSKDDCDFARSLWWVEGRTVHHRIVDIWRYMKPYSLGEIVQILIQAKCITPLYAVQTLTRGDKKEGVTSHASGYVAEMLWVSFAEVEKLLQ